MIGTPLQGFRVSSVTKLPNKSPKSLAFLPLIKTLSSWHLPPAPVPTNLESLAQSCAMIARFLRSGSAVWLMDGSGKGAGMVSESRTNPGTHLQIGI